MEEENKQIETNLTTEIRGLVVGYPYFITFKNKEDSLSLLEDTILAYKLLCFCGVKSKKEEVRKKLKEEKEKLEKIGIKEAMDSYNKYISSSMNFGMGRLRRKIDIFVSNNMNFLIETVQWWLFALPFKRKKDMHLDTAHGLPANVAEDFEQQEIEKGEQVKNLEGPWKLDEEGEVIPV